MNEATQFELEAKRSLFDRGMSGFRLKPALDWAGSDESFCLQLGEHNQYATVFRDGDLRVGVRILCQRDLCLMAQSHFVLEYRSQLYALGMRTTSVMLNPNDYNAVELLYREKAALEELVEKRRADERARDTGEKAELAAQIKQLKEELRLLSQRVNGGKIASGRVWSQDQLIAMCEAQQRED